jgi:predicted GNAT family N-acyltransferase
VRLVPYDPREHREACLALFDGNVGGAFRAEERDEFAAFLSHPPGPYFVLLHGEAVVACAGIAFEDRRRAVASLCWAIVQRPRQGRGLGRLLVEGCLAEAESQASCTSIRLETIPETEAIFQRFGFERVELERDGYGPGLDRVEMRRAVIR